MPRKNKTEYAVLKKVNDINPYAYRPRPMEVINKNHFEITAHRKIGLICFIKIYNSCEIHFSSEAARLFRLRKGKFAHFINTDGYWYFYVNDDKDGFEITQRNRNTAIYNSALVKLFTNRTRCSFPTKFLLTKVSNQVNDCNLIQIDLSKRID